MANIKAIFNVNNKELTVEIKENKKKIVIFKINLVTTFLTMPNYSKYYIKSSKLS